MEIFRFDRGEKIIRNFGSQGHPATRIARGDGRVHLTCLTVEPGGVIGTHPATEAQLFLVIAGEGWTAGPEARWLTTRDRRDMTRQWGSRITLTSCAPGEVLVIAGPGDEKAADPTGRGRLRTSHADRERVIAVLKAAFIQGRLTKDEFDTRVGKVFTSRTYAELAAVTADLPAEPGGARWPRQPVRAQARRSANADVKTAAHVIVGATLVAAPMWAVTLFTSQFVSVISPPAVAVMWLALLVISVAATATAMAASILTVALMIGPRRDTMTPPPDR